jgi:DNA-directed RNA polymerase subunit F
MQKIDLQRLAADLELEEPFEPQRLAAVPAVDYAPPRHRAVGLPSYVQHKEGLGQLGILSAEAVVQQYEIAAKEVEAMGDEMKQVATRCEEIIASAHSAMQHAKDIATQYREDAKRIFEDLENYALLTQDVARTCQTIRQKIAEQTGSA